MEDFIKKAFTVPIIGLEIGTWFGLGSTQIWLNHIKAGSTLMLVDAWKPYASNHDLKSSTLSRDMDTMATNAYLSTLVNIQKFENETIGSDTKVQIVRSDSLTFLPLLGDNSFDFIYIDGDHKYNKVKNDIIQAKRLINKDYGVICGDDLEVLPNAELAEISASHKNEDFLNIELSGLTYNFHPGVLLAVAEEFGTVSMLNGFWWIVCRDGEFVLS